MRLLIKVVGVCFCVFVLTLLFSCDHNNYVNEWELVSLGGEVTGPGWKIKISRDSIFLEEIRMSGAYQIKGDSLFFQLIGYDNQNENIHVGIQFSPNKDTLRMFPDIYLLKMEKYQVNSIYVLR